MTTLPAGAMLYPAAERNKSYILKCLQQYLNETAVTKLENKILVEVGAGTGQHVAHFAPNFPQVDFQPTEFEPKLLNSIEAFRNHLKLPNIRKAAILDVTHPPEKWLHGSILRDSLDYLLSSNMIHITPWICTEGLFKGAAYLLKPGGYLFMYGPFAMDGRITPESNVSFDESLRRQNVEWGLRDITQQLVPMASALGLILVNTHEMPANNKFLAWLKQIK